MRRIAGTVAALCALALLAPAASPAAVAWTRCDSGDVTQCATLPVPLDRTGKVAGEVKLHVERVRARDQPAKAAASAAAKPPHGAIVALAGGPGQPATEFTDDFAFAFGARGQNRDVVAFDQRGTGRSGLLRCPSVERVTLLSSYPIAGEECADRLGAKRAFYTTSDSVDDLEAVREALGVDKIAIYGASYGTKVALAYAARYPTHVERLILDSVLPLDGPDPLYGDTMAAMGRVERASCGDGCDFTKDAGADLSSLGKQLEARAAQGYVYDARGKRRLEAIGSTRLFFLLLAGDFAPDLRAALPGAIYSAAHGDPAVLLRLADLNEAEGEPAKPEDFAAAVYAATLCEESPLPWRHGTPFDQRAGDAAAAAALRGASAFSPLGTTAVLDSDLLALCQRWPEATAAPPTYGPLPDVPALILEGALDLRTPIEGARRVAAQMPHTTFLEIPATGHSTLGSDASDCTLNAITRFLENRTPRSTCADPPAALTPTEPAPLTVDDVARLKGAPKSVARVLTAVGMTIDDVEDQSASQALISFSNDSSGAIRGGGLRGGRFRSGQSGTSVDSYVFVPGLKVSGRLLNRAGRIGSFTFTVGRKKGTIAYHGGGLLTGRYDGHAFRVRQRSTDTTPPTITLGKPAALPRPRVGTIPRGT